jgi:hypothetical protein
MLIRKYPCIQYFPPSILKNGILTFKRNLTLSTKGCCCFIYLANWSSLWAVNTSFCYIKQWTQHGPNEMAHCINYIPPIFFIRDNYLPLLFIYNRAEIQSKISNILPKFLTTKSNLVTFLRLFFISYFHVLFKKIYN